MDRVYFISDVHLGAHSESLESAKIARLTSFLKSIKEKADYLYVVGDLYDFWFEYRKAIPKISLKVAAGLCQLVESGTVVRYFTGNHDLWQDKYFVEEVGVELYHEPASVVHNDLKLFVAHGDGLAAGERKLRFIKKIFKNRQNIFLYRLIHPDIGIPLARYVSGRSKAKGKNPYIAQYREFALKKLEDGFDAVILGHSHEPVLECSGSKYYINLGDWVTCFTYLQLTEKSFNLKTWEVPDET